MDESVNGTVKTPPRASVQQVRITHHTTLLPGISLPSFDLETSPNTILWFDVAGFHCCVANWRNSVGADHDFWAPLLDGGPDELRNDSRVAALGNAVGTDLLRRWCEDSGHDLG